MGAACEGYRPGGDVTMFYIVVEGTDIRRCNDEHSTDPMKFDTCEIAQDYINIRYSRSPLHHVPISIDEYKAKYGHEEAKR